MTEKDNLKSADESTSLELDFDLGNDSLFAVCNNGIYFYIAFDKLFGQPQFSIYNTFEMSSKRNFKNLSSLIYETYVELFTDENGKLKDEAEILFFNFLKIKSDIMVAESTPYDIFLKYIETLLNCGDRFIIKLINKFVDEHYALDLDAITEATRKKKHKINTELQFNDDHAKSLLKISYLYRVMIPIISVYFYYNKNNFNSIKVIENDTDIEMSTEELEEMKFDEVNSLLFAHLFDQFATDPEALRNKLYKLAYSGVSKTAYSDKKFWLAAKNVAITEQTEALEIYKKLIINAIPKLSIEADKNVVNFLQSVINNQVDFLFQNKFKNHLIPLGGGETGYSTESNDDSNMTEFERIEIQQSRKDEGDYLIRKLNINDVVEHIPEKFNVGVSDAEVKEMMQKVKRNAIQEQIIAFLTFKYFNDKNALKFVSFYQYCYLLIACKKYLIQQKYIYLPLILTAVCEKHRERVNISGKKVRPQILSSKKFKDLIEKKYPNLNEEVEKPFLSIIGTVYSSVFKDTDGNEIFDSSVKVGKIAEEIVDLAGLI